MSLQSLKIANGLTLPLDTVTQAIGILAKRRAGKSYCARRITEQLLAAGQQIIIVDPKGDWHGIRSSADGKGPGYPVIILGGEHGDIPLEVNSGEMVANLVTEKRVSILLDLSVFRKHEVATFMTAFLENLYRLKAKEIYRTPAMLVIDEADAVAPQKPQKGEERMLGAAEDIVRRGGQRGIGCMLITQRSAVLNKNVLTQIAILIGLRTIAPQDLEAMKAWIDAHGTIEQQKTLMGSLPSLPIGDAWFWSPGWPKDDGIFKRVHILPIETFDSGATPRPGEKRIEPKKPADIDMDALRHSMAETVKRADDNNPAKLKHRIKELERKLTLAEKGQPSPRNHQEEIAKLKDEVRQWGVAYAGLSVPTQARIDLIKKTIAEFNTRVSDELSGLSSFMEERHALRFPNSSSVVTPAPVKPRIAHDNSVTIHSPRYSAPAYAAPAKVQGRSDSSVPNSHRRLLDALAWFEMFGLGRVTQQALAGRCGMAWSGGAFQKYRSALRTAGLIDYENGMVFLTEAGRRSASRIEQAPTLEALHESWLSIFPNSHRKILAVLIDAHPKSMSQQEVAESVGMEASGGAFQKYRSKLKTLGAIEYVNGGMRASDLLFPEGLV